MSAEERWEHKLLLVPVWFFALGIVLMAGLGLRRARSAGGAGDSDVDGGANGPT